VQVKLKVTQPQADFLNLTCKYPAFVAGFGTGKSEVMCTSALLDSLEGGSDSLIAMYEPTYDLVRLILAPRMEEKLIDWGIRYKYNKSENIIYTSNGQLGDFVLRTLDNPARIIGYESFRSKIDELDTLPTDKAREAWVKIIARNRQNPSTYIKQTDKPMNTVSVFTTPEGFKFVYERWKKEKFVGHEMIQASTMSNPYLPDDYVQTLRDSYPEQLIEAYLNGEFVNLTSGTVYNQYDRKANHTDRVWDGKEPVYIGMDFNVGQMSAVVHVKDKDGPRAIDEIVKAYDTPDIINIIKSRYQNCTIRVYPDASGGSRKSVNASVTDLALLSEAGFGVIANKKNPFVKDRVLAMNRAFCDNSNNRMYLVNAIRCPSYADCLEQQVWNDNGEPDKTQGKDHANDAGGYFIAYDYPVIKPVAADIRFTL
jgi:hypothetical protein